MSRSPQLPPSTDAPLSFPLTPSTATVSPRPVAHGDRRGEQRGSVLIFVVGVLLLLAILATAFLGSSRADRTATQQNAFNTQVDLLIDGIVNAAKGRIASDESVPGGTTTENFDAYTFGSTTGTPTNDDWLAARVPTTADLNSVFANNATNDLATATSNPAWWLAITNPVLGSTFESPYRATGSTIASTYTLRDKDLPQAIPTFLKFGGKNWPAFRVSTGNFATPNYQTFMAADADGDGVADSGLFKIPVGELAGLTYYGAVRIIDNNAAINVNTALSRDYDFDGVGNGNLVSIVPTTGLGSASPAGAFTSNVGLAEILRSTLLATNPNQLPPAPAAQPFFDKMSATSAGTYTAGFPEFTAFFQYRSGIPDDVAHQPRPSGVDGITSTDTGPYDDTDTTGGTVGPRPDFQFSQIGEMLATQIGNRTANPNVTKYTGTLIAPGTLYNGKSAFVEGLSLAARFSIGSIGEYDYSRTAISKLSLTTALAPSIEYGPGLAFPGAKLRTTPYTGQSGGAGIDNWFGTHFNYLFEDATDSSTFMNRRTILTAANGVAEQTTSPATAGSTYNYLFDDNYFNTVSQWGGTGGTPLVVRNPVAYDRYPKNGVNGIVNVPTVPMAVPAGLAKNDSKVSIVSARFEELFYGFFRVVSNTEFTGTADELGTPFTKRVNGAVGSSFFEKAIQARSSANFLPANGIYANESPATNEYYLDPYIGTRFVASAAGAGTLTTDRVEPAGQNSVVNGQTNVAEQHPLRMFRSPLRAVAVRTAAGTPPAAAVWGRLTPRLPADQVLILRSALAAANLEALRDSSHNPAYANAGGTNEGGNNDRVVAHKVPLTAYINNTAVPVVANVYGLRRQVFITEVYANTSTSATDNAGGAPAPPGPNPRGYVAIKLYNPNSVPISLQNCRLIGLHRMRDVAYNAATSTVTPSTTTTVATQDQYPNMSVGNLVALSAANSTTTDQIDLSTAVSNTTTLTYDAYVVPANGTLVLENVPPSIGGGLVTTAGEDANHRPTSSGLITISPTNVNTGPLTGSATQNFAYVPGLSRVVWDRELVLMRPPNSLPPLSTPPAGIPVNTLTYVFPDPTNVPLSAVVDMVPMDSYDFTGLIPFGPAAAVDYPPGRTRAEVWHYVRTVSAIAAWQWVYPGRYDGDQSIPVSAGELPAPRQQGTYRASGSDGLFGWDPGVDKDPITENPPMGVTVSLGTAIAGGTTATFPDIFTIQLNATGWPGDHALHDYATAGATPNRFPFGGFRKLADMLQTPFIGSYTIRTEQNTADIIAGTAGVVPSFLEVNPVTLDSVFAEDTDPADNEHGVANPPADNGMQSREQIGRFIPLRPSRGTLATNGTPAVETADPSPPTGSPPRYAADYDPAFNINVPGSLDPLRYRDDLLDDPAAALPTAASSVDARVNRYQWANGLFDYFTISSPHDDSVPNYPTQPKWRPGMAYSVGDTVQYGQDVFVCYNAHTSPIADPPAAAEIVGGTPATTSIKLAPPSAAANANWRPLLRNPLANASARAGSRSDRVAAGRSNEYYEGDDTNEVSQSTPGLININTAPEKVLAALPWSPRTGTNGTGDNLTITFNTYPPTCAAGPDGIDDNAQIAHMIVLYRDGNYTTLTSPVNNLTQPSITYLDVVIARAATPFTSLWDLYKVPGFRYAQNMLLMVPGVNPSQTLGDYSPPYDPAQAARTDNVRFDFEEQTLLLNHVSNLITTRSDFFTIYALVQGWRNVGTANPQLVVQRRAAFIVDRSGATATSQTLSSSRVPVN